MSSIIITLAKEAGKIGVDLLKTYGKERIRHAAKPTSKPTAQPAPQPTPDSTGKVIAKIIGGLGLSLVTAYATECVRSAAKNPPSIEYEQEYAKTKARQDAIRDSKDGVIGYPYSQEDEIGNPQSVA